MNTTTTFGTRLRLMRLELALSQAELATLLRQTGNDLGEPNTCNKRLIQKWELGEHHTCRPNYRRALTHALGVSYEQLSTPWAEPQPPDDTTPPAPPAPQNPEPTDTETALQLIDSVMAQLADARTRLGARLGRGGADPDPNQADVT
jgi:transcriptional regulator with XRE-family HTH domain